jgi:hypothetical protein
MQLLQRYLLLLSFILPHILMGQNTKEETIDWSATRKLTWADYKASPDPNSDAAASTSTLLSIQYSFKNGGFTYTIESKFSKTSSWGLHKTDYILKHEQGHFDIAEYFARKLNMKMKNYQFDKRRYQKDLGKIYNDITDEKEKMQNLYDKETNHSINKEKQEEWLKKIADMLEELKEYADY